MAERSNIEGCDATFNPWIGCTKISPACDHCYAEALMATRFQQVQWGSGQQRARTSTENWKEPLRWNAKACWFVQCNECGWRGESRGAVCGHCHSADTKPARRRVFCASLADVFDNEVDVQWRRDLFDLIAATPNLDWLLLTKRIGNAKTMMADALHLNPAAQAEGRIWPLPNVWLGATICNQDEADRDIPKLLTVPARVRFVSIEPMLGPVDLTNWLSANALHEIDGGPRIDWIIDGGESGPHARPMHPDWARSLRDQCAAAGVPFLFKQRGEWGTIPGHGAHYPAGIAPDGSWRGPEDQFTEDCALMYRIGKKAAGRLLDGVEHNGFPEVTP